MWLCATNVSYNKDPDSYSARTTKPPYDCVNLVLFPNTGPFVHQFKSSQKQLSFDKGSSIKYVRTEGERGEGGGVWTDAYALRTRGKGVRLLRTNAFFKNINQMYLHLINFIL